MKKSFLFFKNSTVLSISAIISLAGFILAFLIVESEVWFLGLMVLGLVLLGGFRKHKLDTSIKKFSEKNPSYFYLVVMISIIGILYFLRNQHFPLFMLASVAIFSTVCLGLTIQLGYAGLTNFAAAAFFGIGGYTMFIMGQKGFSDINSLFIAGFMAAFMSSLLILPILRTRGHYAALVTIAFALLFKTFLEINDSLGGPQGVKLDSIILMGWDFSASYLESSFYLNYAVFSLILMIGTFFFTLLLDKSWIGLQWDAIRQDETVSASFGINVAGWKILAFVLGNFFIGLSGAVYATMLGHIAPTNFTFGDSLLFISIVILGGIGNPLGIIPASLIIFVVPEKLQFIQEYRHLLFAVLVILVLLYRPDGFVKKQLRSYYRGWGKNL